MFPETTETSRLTLTQFCQSNVDVFALYDLFKEGGASAAGVFEYVPQEPYESVKDAHDHLTEAETEWNDQQVAQYAVYTASDDLAGSAVLSLDWDRRTGTLGVILARPFWGRDYARECAMGLTEIAFNRLDLEVVAIGYEDGNHQSKQAVEKYIDAVGGQYDGVLRNWTPIGGNVADHHRYTVTQEEYQQRDP